MWGVGVERERDPECCFVDQNHRDKRGLPTKKSDFSLSSFPDQNTNKAERGGDVVGIKIQSVCKELVSFPGEQTYN